MQNFIFKSVYNLWVNRVKPIKAFSAIRALDRNREDTTQVFHVIEALKGNSDRQYFKIFSESKTGKNILNNKLQLVDVLKDKEYLSKLPKDTLGFKYYEFIYKENLSPDELIEASEISSGKHYSNRGISENEIFFNTRKRDMHDLWHVATGYGRDALGELSLLAFTYAQEQNRGVGAIALYGYWKVGKVPGAQNLSLRQVIYEGYTNGKIANLWSCEDWEKLIELPLDDVRKRINSKKPNLYLNALENLSLQQINLNNNQILTG